MSVATTTAIAIAGGVAAAGGVASAAIGSHAAGEAAKTQSDAAKSAAQLQKEEADKALAFQQQQWTTQQQNEAPFLQQGTTAVNNLANLVNDPNFSKYPGGTFSAPTLEEARNTPGYQFQLEQGTHAIDSNAAATGNLLSGTTGTALEQYGQGLADSNYSADYARALNTYMTNYGVWNTDTSNRVNRLQALANTGTNAAANLGSQGQAAANNTANIALTTGAQQGQDINNAAAATASGIVGSANAINNGLSGITNFAGSLPLYSLLGQQQQALNKSSYNNLPTFNGGSVGGVPDPFLGTPGYMPQPYGA